MNNGLYTSFPFTASPGTGPGRVASFGSASADDHKVLADSLDTVPEYLAGKLLAGAGVSITPMQVAPGPVRELLIAATASPQANYSQELYSYALGETESAITRSGVAGTDASGWRGFAFVAGRNFHANYMSVAIRNTGGTWMLLGLFDASGNLLAKTGRFSPVSNSIVSAPLTTPVDLIGATGYYMAYWTDDTTGNLQFSCLSGRSTSNRSPLMQRNDFNENTTMISSAFAFTALRPWLMVME